MRSAPTGPTTVASLIARTAFAPVRTSAFASGTSPAGVSRRGQPPIGRQCPEGRYPRERAASAPRPPAFSGQQLLDHMPMHVGEAAVDAVVAHRQLLVVDAQKMQHGGVNVVDLRRLA